MTNVALRVTDEAVVTTPMFRVRGQVSRWNYPHTRLTPEHCEILQDVNISEEGVAQSRYGTAKYNTAQVTGGATPTGLYQVKFANGTEENIVTTPEKILVNSGGSAWTDKTGSDMTGTADNHLQFGFIKDKVILNNKVDPPRSKAVGANTANISGVPFTKAEGFFTHQNLLIFYGTTESSTFYPTRIRWCDINRATHQLDIDTWRADNRYEIYDGGPKIVGAVDAWGIALIFKEDGLYPGRIYFDTIGNLDFRLDDQLLQRGFSPVSTLGIGARPEVVWCVAKEGIAAFDRSLNFRIVNSDDLKEWLSLNKGRYNKIQSWVREKDHQVRFLCSSSSNSTGHDRILVWDWESDDIWFDRPTKVTNYGSSVDIDDEELDWFGATDGYVYQGNKSSYSDDDGTGFAWHIKMSPNDLGFPGRQKKVINVVTVYRKRAGEQNITFKGNIDEGRKASVTGDLDLGQSIQWNSGKLWGTGEIWPGANARRSDFFVNRMCETIAPEWTSSDPANIYGYFVEFILLET